MSNLQTDAQLSNLSDSELGNALRAALKADDQAQVDAKKAKNQRNPRSEGYLLSARRLFDGLEAGSVVDPYSNPVWTTMEMINDYLSWAGASITELDETGQTSYDQMEQRISDAKKRTYLLTAKAALEILENLESSKYNDQTPRAYLETIYLQLSLSQGLEAQINQVRQEDRSYCDIKGVDLTLLDETGKASNDDMEVRLSNAVQNGNVFEARRRLERLQKGLGTSGEFGYSGGDYIDSYVRSIHMHIEQSGEDASCLDEAGQKSEAEMLGVLAEAEKGYRVRAARQRYSCLQSPTLIDQLCTGSWTDEIRELFNTAGVDAACLDETGQKSAYEMEAKFQETLDAIQARRANL
jgi:hypothetical protein